MLKPILATPHRISARIGAISARTKPPIKPSVQRMDHFHNAVHFADSSSSAPLSTKA